METHTVQKDKAVLSINTKSVPFHRSERPFSVALSLFSFFLHQHPHNSSDSGWLFQHGSKDRQHTGQWGQITDQDM